MISKQKFYKVILYVKNGGGQREQLISKCEELFKDTNGNLKRWLAGKPCIFFNPSIKGPIEIEIGSELEALYYFLEFCRRLEVGEPIDDDFSEYLFQLIECSNHPSRDCR